MRSAFMHHTSIKCSFTVACTTNKQVFGKIIDLASKNGTDKKIGKRSESNARKI